MGNAITADRTDPAFLPEPTQAMPAVPADALAAGALHNLLVAVLASAAVLAVVGGAALARVGEPDEPGLAGPVGAASTVTSAITIEIQPSTSDEVGLSPEVAGAAGCGLSSCLPGPLALSAGPSDIDVAVTDVAVTAPADPADAVVPAGPVSTTPVAPVAVTTRSAPAAADQQRTGEQSRAKDGGKSGKDGGKGEGKGGDKSDD